METGLARIENEPTNPMELFKEWFAEAKASGDVLQPNTFCMATSTKSGRVSSRNLLLRRLDEDGFVMVTTNGSKKTQEIAENPYCAITFVWVYNKENSRITRQVRIEGNVEQLPRSEYQDIYDEEPLFCKLRSHACSQGSRVVWEELKQTHDKLYKEYLDGNNQLAMPDNFVGYKLQPTMMEFYYGFDKFIGDRFCYLKANDEWEHFRIAA